MNATYCYDANGNMTAGDGRSATYSAFDKPLQVAMGLTATTFRYGPDRARFEKTKVGPGGTTVTTYIGGAFYEEENSPSGLRKKHDLAGVAVLIDDGAGTETHYLLWDHLGSVETITDDTAAVIERTSFDAPVPLALGERRRAEDWTALAESGDLPVRRRPRAVSPATRCSTVSGSRDLRASTGRTVHAHSTRAGASTSPSSGRFLSADPFVQDATNSARTSTATATSSTTRSPTPTTQFCRAASSSRRRSAASAGSSPAPTGAPSPPPRRPSRTPSRPETCGAWAWSPPAAIPSRHSPGAAYTCPSYLAATALVSGGSLLRGALGARRRPATRPRIPAVKIS